jgi:hypothetical protein
LTVAATSTFASQPTIDLDNATVDLGSFLKNFLQPDHNE